MGLRNEACENYNKILYRFVSGLTMKRERSTKEIVSVLTEYAREGKEELEYDYRDEKKVAKVLEMIENLDRKEMENLEDKEVKAKCLGIYKDSEGAKKALKAGNFQKVHSYLDRIIELEKQVYQNLDSGDLSEEFSRGEFLGEGNNAEVYEIENRKGIVLKIFKFENPEQKLQEVKKYRNLEKQLLDRFEETSIAGIKKVGLYEGSAAAVMEKAPGNEVHLHGEDYQRWSRMNDVLANADVSHFESVVKDIQRISDYFDMFVDPKCDNFFYHPEAGFTIIDLGKDIFAGKSYSQFPDLLTTFTEYGAAGNPRFYAEEVTKEDVENMKEIAEKLEAAGAPIPEYAEEKFRSTIEEILAKM
jgi:hypothetical protein